MRFYNEYGVCIFNSLYNKGKEVFEILVVRLNGLVSNDYELLNISRSLKLIGVPPLKISYLLVSWYHYWRIMLRL
jgi:hypothetical protein